MITLHLEDTVPEGAAIDLLDQAKSDLTLFHAYMEDYRLLDGPARTGISGVRGRDLPGGVPMLHADAVGSCPFRERTYYVRQDTPIYRLRMCDFPEIDPRLVFDYDEFLRRVCFR